MQNKKTDCKFILCPVCGNKTHTMIREDTELKKLSALLSEVQERDNYQCLGYENHACRVQTKSLKYVLPPYMGNAIAAVFLCLSAVPVKGFPFLFWLIFLPALLLQLSYQGTVNRIKQHPIGNRKQKTITADHLQAYMDFLSFGGIN